MIYERAHVAKRIRKTPHSLDFFFLMIGKTLQKKKKHKIREILGDMLKKKRTK